MRLILFLLFFTDLLSAQLFTFGVKGGVPLSDDLDTVFASSESKPYVVGPMVTAKLPFRLRLEFNALYRRAGYRSPGSDVVGDVYDTGVRGNSWEFPILVRRTLTHGLYVAAGYGPRVVHGNGHTVGVFTTSLSPLVRVFRDFDTPVEWNTTHGVIGSLGIDRRFGPLHLAPEVRYTYWTGSALDVTGPQGFSIRLAQHQVDLLVGISF